MPLTDLKTKKGQDALTKLLNSAKGFKEHPNRVEGPHPLYKDMVTHAMEMGVHIWGELPKKLLKIKRPREDPEITKYRLDTFEPITQSKSDKALTILLKIFNTKLWSIIYKDNDQGEALKVFLEKRFYLFGDFMLYVQKVLMKNMLADANAVTFYRPLDFSINQNETIFPIPVIFESWQILDYVPDTYYILLDAEVLKDKNRKVHQVWIVDLEKIEKWKQKHTTEGIVWVNEIEWVHGLGIVPVWPLGGQVNGRFQGLFYTSFFNPARPHWNKVINSDSDLDGAFVNSMHPIRIEVGTDCDFIWNDQQCINGRVLDTAKNKNVVCPECKGSGRKSVKSPYGVYIVNKEKFGEGDAGFEPVSFATVPTEPTKLLMERNDKQLTEGLGAINMEIVDKIGENQSGVAKEIDRDGLNTTYQTVSDHVFTVHIFNLIWFTGVYLFKTAFTGDLEAFKKDAISETGWFPAIVKPTQFDTMTIKEITKQLIEAKEGKLSSGFIQSLQIDLNNKQFHSNPLLLKRINAITRLNPIPEKSVAEIIEMTGQGLTKKENAAISLNIEFLVDTAITRDAAFLEKTREEKLKELEKLSSEFNLSVAPPVENN